MWNGFLTLDGTLWQILFRVVIVYIFMLVALRLFGKRELGQLSAFDLTLLLLIANTVQNAMTGPDTSLDGGILAAVALLALSYAVTWLDSRSILFRKAVIGVPTVLAAKGAVIQRALRREDITEEEFMAALREHGVESMNDVALAVMEVDGSISVIPKDTSQKK